MKERQNKQKIERKTKEIIRIPAEEECGGGVKSQDGYNQHWLQTN